MKKKKIYTLGYIKINIAYNNIFITLTDNLGKVLLKYSGGTLHFKGRKKKNPYVAGKLVQSLLFDLKKSLIFIKFLIIDLKSFLKKKEMYNIIKALSIYHNKTKKIKNKKFNRISKIIFVKYNNVKAHNGMRGKKKRRT